MDNLMFFSQQVGWGWSLLVDNTHGLCHGMTEEAVVLDFRLTGNGQGFN
jgi:hypothetical protein